MAYYLKVSYGSGIATKKKKFIISEHYVLRDSLNKIQLSAKSQSLPYDSKRCFDIYAARYLTTTMIISNEVSYLTCFSSVKGVSLTSLKHHKLEYPNRFPLIY